MRHLRPQCLTARRLVERGVRFVQIFAGKSARGDGSVPDVPWDGHDNIETNHRSCAAATDQPDRRPAGRPEEPRPAR